MKRLIASFRFAFNGISSLIKTGGNIHIHLIAAITVVVVGLYFSISSIEWTILLLCIGIVISAEGLNTSIEKLPNLVSPEFNAEAGKIKDIAAASVLILAIIAVIIAVIIFYPYCIG